jgi:hypothetical protein
MEGPEAKFGVVLNLGSPVPGTAGTPAGLIPAQGIGHLAENYLDSYRPPSG